MRYKIKERRKQLGVTQAELAEKADVSRTIISRLESDQEFETTTTTLKKLAEALDTTVSHLLF